ncbi:ATP-binding protein [Vagococcus sp. JNUCC 83]
MKLFTKNFLYTMTIIFTVTTLILLILYFLMPKYYLYSQEIDAQEKIDKIVSILNGQTSEDIEKALLKSQSENTNLMLNVTNKSTGEVIYPNYFTNRGDENVMYLEIDSLFINEVSDVFTRNITNKKGEQLLLTAQYSLQHISDASAILIKLYPLLLVVALILGGIAAFFYSKYSTKRVLSLMDTTTNMRSLNPTIRCDITGNDEISQLSNNINRLYDTHLQTISMLKKEVKKVEETEQSKSNFMRMASHELKTPLAGMTGIVDGMLYNVGKFKDRDKYLKVCQTLLKEQSDLIQNILSVTSLDSLSNLQNVSEEVSIKSIVEDQLETYLLLGDFGEYTISKQLKEDTVIMSNPLMVERVVSNLLSNAFRYTPHGKRVYIELQGNVLTIENNCQPLKNESIDQLYEPFYRSDYSRDKNSGGSGLGLYIVKQIVDKNAWEVEINTTVSGNFIASVKFKSVDIKA